MASRKHRSKPVSRKVLMPVAHRKPKGHNKQTILQNLVIHLAHESFSPIHRTPGHDAMGGQRAPPGH